MGRLPLQFSGRTISWRLPYAMPGSIFIAPSQSGLVFPDATFQQNIDKPFEIHRVKFNLTAFNDATPALMFEPQPTTLEERISLALRDLGKNENLTRQSALISTLTRNNEKTWEWEEPYTIVRSEGFQVQMDSQPFTFAAFSTLIPSNPAPTIASVRVEVTFEGFLIIVAPPTENR